MIIVGENEMSEDLQSRINGLSDAQRIELTNKIRLECGHLTTGTEVPHRQLLTAYVKSRSGCTDDADEIRRYLAKKLPAHMIPFKVIFLRKFPRLPNGKIDRQQLAGRTEGQNLPAGSPDSVAEQCLADIWSTVLRIEAVGAHDNFFELGGDSILAIQIVSRARRYGYRFTPAQLVSSPTISQLAHLVTGDNTDATGASGQEHDDGEFPLTPIQSWFFEQVLPERNHYNMAFVLDASCELDSVKLRRVLQAIMAHHDALKLRFHATEHGWHQVNGDNHNPGKENLPFTVCELAGLSSSQQDIAMAETIKRLQASLDITLGPLVQMAFFKLGSGRPDRLLIIVHHLAIDGVSCRILVEDIETAYNQLSRNREIQLPLKSTPYLRWAKEVRSLIASGKFNEEIFYWTSLEKSQPIPVDFENGENLESNAKTIEVLFEKTTTTELLQTVPAVYNTRVNEILLAALAQAFFRWKQLSAVLIEVEHHGREGYDDTMDFSRTVGWFTIAHPFILRFDKRGGPGDLIKATKEQFRRVPGNGSGYWNLRYGDTPDAIKSQIKELPLHQVSFNYFGQLDRVSSKESFLTFTRHDAGTSYSPAMPRPYLLEINSSITDGQMGISLRYSSAIHKQSTMEDLCVHFKHALEEIISHCQAPEAGGYTPSDFPTAHLDQDELDQLNDELG